MKIKTAELTGAALDWAVAKCEDALGTDDAQTFLDFRAEDYSYSTDWAQGGPIIEREKLSFREERPGVYFGYVWNGTTHKNLSAGPTPLIAAMRCYVASKLGDEVEVPDELS